MPDHLDSVNEIIRTYEKFALTSAGRGDHDTAQRQRRWANDLTATVAELRSLRDKVRPLSTRLGDLSDLPPELRAELSGIDLDEIESQLVQTINAYGGTADLNQILVGLYRKFQVIAKRRVLAQRLWRMQNDRLVWAVPKKKGVYTTTKPADDLSDFGSPGPTAVRERKPAMAGGRRDDMDDEIPF